MKVLVINAGSSSIKYQLFDMPARTILAKGMVERIGEADSNLVHQYSGNKHASQIDIADHDAGMAVIPLKTSHRSQAIFARKGIDLGREQVVLEVGALSRGFRFLRTLCS